MYDEAVHGWLKNVRSRYPEPSYSVIVTIDWRRRVCRLVTRFTRAITVAYAPIFSSPTLETCERSMYRRG